MNKIQLLLCSASIFAVAAGAASAAGFEVVDPMDEPTSSVIGSVGLTFGESDLTDDDGDDEGDGRYNAFDANIGYMFSGGHLISVDLGLRDDARIDHGSTGSSAFSQQKHAALQYMYNMPSGFGIGAFTGVTRAPHNPSNEDYTGSFYGLTGVASIGPGTAFVQYAKGDTEDDESSRGFQDGSVWRAGYVFSVHSSTDVIIDLEQGKSDRYEDDDEPGEFVSVYLGGETQLGAFNDWSMTYGVRHAEFDALNDPDFINEDTVEIGFRYNFGGSTTAMDMSQGLIGTPHIIKRANQIVPLLD